MKADKELKANMEEWNKSSILIIKIKAQHSALSKAIKNTEFK